MDRPRIKAEPCPCCGKDPIVTWLDGVWTVQCNGYGCKRDVLWRGMIREKVINAWNEQIRDERRDGTWSTCFSSSR